MNKFLNMPSYNMDYKTLQNKLMDKLHEYFKLRMQLKMGKLKQSHLLRQARRNIVSIKSDISRYSIDKNK